METKHQLRKDTPVYGYDGRYTVNTNGDVFGKAKGRLLKPHLACAGRYKMLTLLTNSGKKTVCYLHQIMAVSFLNSNYKENGLVVDHINGDKTNNALKNLRVVTQSKNLENREAKHYYFCEQRKRFCVAIKRVGVKFKKRFVEEQDAQDYISYIKKSYE
jgi:hypothetical protein